MGFNTLIDVLQTRAQDQFKDRGFTFQGDNVTDIKNLSHQELDRLARKIGAVLQSMGMQGKRAVLLYPPSLEYIAGFFGCLYAGVIAVPAYPPDPNRLNRTLPRLLGIIKDSQASVVLTTESIHSMAGFLFSQAPELEKLKWIATDHLPDPLAQEWQTPDIQTDTLAFLQYTSGSTGHPKGVMLSHKNLLHNLEFIKRNFGIDTNDQGISWLPPYHDMGLIGGILGSIYSAIVNCVLMSPLTFLRWPYRWLEAISRTQGSISGAPNFAYELCVRKVTPQQRDTLDLSHWDLAFSGAEPIRQETMDRFVEFFGPCGFKREAFYPCYGLAEGTLIVSGGEKEKPAVIKKITKQDLHQSQEIEDNDIPEGTLTLVSCGSSFFDQTVKVVRPNSFTLAPEREVGEIWIKGDSVALGYWNQPQETELAFQAKLAGSGEGPFLRTGDIGFFQDGELFVTGRIKDLIIIRGSNHYPQDIEWTVEQCHSAARAGCGAAFSVDVDAEERLVIVQEVESTDQNSPKLDYDQIISTIRQVVAEQHDIQVYDVCLIQKGSIPKTSSGKIRRHACREEFLTRKLEVLSEYRVKISQPAKTSLTTKSNEEVASIATTNKTQKLEVIETWLVQQLSQRLGLSVNEIDVKQPLARYGLDSKEAVNLSGELEDWLGCSLSPTVLWKYPTIETLALYLSSEERLAT